MAENPGPSAPPETHAEERLAPERPIEKKPHASLNWLFVGVAILVVGGALGLAGRFPEINGHYGFWSILPPVVAIVLAFWTREVVSALFIGIALGGVIAGELNIVQEFLIPAIGTADFALILLERWHRGRVLK
jgi:hypothetical protein